MLSSTTCIFLLPYQNSQTDTFCTFNAKLKKRAAMAFEISHPHTWVTSQSSICTLQKLLFVLFFLKMTPSILLTPESQVWASQGPKEFKNCKCKLYFSYFINRFQKCSSAKGFGPLMLPGLD